MSHIAQFYALNFGTFGGDSINVSLGGPYSTLTFRIVFANGFGSRFTCLIVVKVTLSVFFRLVMFVLQRQARYTRSIQYGIKIEDASYRMNLGFGATRALDVFTSNVRNASTSVFNGGVQV